MAAAIERRSRYLRDFAHAMSHEFKTPLSGIRGAIELLEDHDATMSAEERRRFLANADADARRLARLVSRLLDLARADMLRGDGGRLDDPADRKSGVSGTCGAGRVDLGGCRIVKNKTQNNTPNQE